MNSNRRPAHFQRSIWAAILLAFGFLLCQPQEVLAQNQVTTPGGTINKIPKWNPATNYSLIDSTIYDNGNVGIGTTAPAALLNVKRGTNSDSTGQPSGTFASIIYNATNAPGENGLLIKNNWANSASTPLEVGVDFVGGAYTSLFKINAAGNVGIGTTSPNGGLHIANAGPQWSSSNFGTNLILDNAAAARNTAIGIFDAYNSNPWAIANVAGVLYFSQMPALWNTTTAPTTKVVIDTSGNVGIGTANPNGKLTVAYDSALSFPTPGQALSSLHVVPTTNSNDNTAGITFGANNSGGAMQTTAQAGIYVQSSGAYGTKMYFGTTNSYATGSQTRMMIDHLGNVGVGTTIPQAKLDVVGNAKVTGDFTVAGTGNITATGNISATGVINAKYQDLAEWVPASHAIAAGTVVVLDPDQSNHVLASLKAYDTRVAGVVSAKPGVILGEGGEGKVMVATTGRVRVKVDATLAPIRVGDLLVTSDKEGIAMRSLPLDLGGTPIHRPGTLIGKALEPLDKGVGEILVLLSLQ